MVKTTNRVDGLAACARAMGASMIAPVRIDSHQHFWNYSPKEYAWIDGRMQRIARDFLPDDLEPELRRSRLDGCIAVQAHSSLRETEFLLECAGTRPFVRAVVGWADLCAADAESTVARLAANPRLRGLRHIVQAEPDDFLLRADFQRGVRTLARHKLVYDILIFPRQLAAATQFVQALPDQPFVLDHLAKPDIARAAPDDRSHWERGLRALARHPNVACKLSGMVTEAAWNTWQPADFTFYLDVALDAFGEDRLLFGTDWPVCLVAARDHSQVHDLLANWAAKLSPIAQSKLFGDNAARIYGIA